MLTPPEDSIKDTGAQTVGAATAKSAPTTQMPQETKQNTDGSHLPTTLPASCNAKPYIPPVTAEVHHKTLLHMTMLHLLKGQSRDHVALGQQKMPNHPGSYHAQVRIQPPPCLIYLPIPKHSNTFFTTPSSKYFTNSSYLTFYNVKIHAKLFDEYSKVTCLSLVCISRSVV
jgi:hypothetical protein